MKINRKITVDIQKEIGEFTLDVAFSTQAGQVGILGASGCGKSQTLKCIAGIETPTSGQIIVNDKVLFDSKKGINVRPQERNIGYLFQNYALFPTMTVKENILTGLNKKEKVSTMKHYWSERKAEKAKHNEIVEELMERFQIKEYANRLPNELSGGQQQRVALARIMAYEPDLILLDEPFSALDTYLKESLLQEMEELLANYHGQIMLVSHNRDEIYTFGEELFIMERGKIEQCGKTREIFRKPKTFAAAKLTGCKNIASIERRDAHQIYVKDWDMVLQTKETVTDAIKYVGIRAHEITPVTIDEMMQIPDQLCNVFPLELVKKTEAPFENWYRIKRAQSNAITPFWWKVSKQLKDDPYREGMPTGFLLSPDNLLLLE